jgi:hypothetical protein
MSYNNNRQTQVIPGPPPRDQYFQQQQAQPNAPAYTQTFTQRLQSEGKGIMKLTDIEELRSLRAFKKANEVVEELRAFNSKIMGVFNEAINGGALDHLIQTKVSEELARLTAGENRASGSRKVAAVATELTKLQKLATQASQAVKVTIAVAEDFTIAEEQVIGTLVEYGFPGDKAKILAGMDHTKWTKDTLSTTVMARGFLTMAMMNAIYEESVGESPSATIGASKASIWLVLGDTFLPILKRETEPKV